MSVDYILVAELDATVSTTTAPTSTKAAHPTTSPAPTTPPDPIPTLPSIPSPDPTRSPDPDAEPHLDLLTPLEFSEHFPRISRNRIYELLKCGRIQHIKIGRRFLIPASEITSFPQREMATP